MSSSTKSDLVTDYIWALKELGLYETEKKDSNEFNFTSSKDFQLKGHLNQKFNSKVFIDKFIKHKKANMVFKIKDSWLIKIEKLLKESNVERIYLHCGTPKTGSSSFQSTLYNKLNCLAKKSILYPSNIKSFEEPKHQKIVNLMKKDDFEGLLGYFSSMLAEAEKKKRTFLVISTEGIFNHWEDFSDDIKMTIGIFNKFIPITVLLVIRNPVSYLYSMYLQNLRNPQMAHPKCYGKDLSFEQMLDDAWFFNHIDYVGFLLDIERMIGIKNIRLFSYSNQVVIDLFEAIGVSLKSSSVISKNITPYKLSENQLRKINQLNLPRKEKKEFLSQVTKKNNNMEKQDIDPRTIDKINTLFSLQSSTLNHHFGFEF